MHTSPSLHEIHESLVDLLSNIFTCLVAYKGQRSLYD